MSDIRLDFINNTADIAGSSVYTSDVLYSCSSKPGRVSGLETFQQIFNVSNTESDPSAVTSNPRDISACMPGHHLPIGIPTHVSAYPGEVFTAITGAMDGTTVGSVYAKFPDSPPTTHLGPLQDTQRSKYASCNDFKYSVFSTKKNIGIDLSAVNPSYIFLHGYLRYSITVSLQLGLLSSMTVAHAFVTLSLDGMIFIATLLLRAFCVQPTPG